MLSYFQIPEILFIAIQCCLLGLAQNLATLFTMKVISGLVAIDK